eukprot:Nitzschia sp. Nitz4//scaffold56_size114212//93479//96757//NITZ4_003966-RA/size114212-processed-gene-0.13-mRNA-1//1//CDS//3329554754//6256//frame0
MKNRSTASGLIQELQEACHRSLYNGNDMLVGGSSKLGKDWEDFPTSADNASMEIGPNKRARREGTRGTSSISTVRSWETIVTDAAVQLPGMSDVEHGQVCHLVSILLLGWFLPGSTGNDFFLLQHRSSLAVETPSCFTDATARDLALCLPLAERLESIPHKFSPSEFGEFDALTDDRFDAAMTSFVVRALGQLLDARPVHTNQVDWLHLIAMAIHPNPSEQPIRQTVNHLESKNSSYWEYTQTLMRSLHAPNFAVNYRHRRLLVQLVVDHLCLPDVSNPSVPLLQGALPHLRASLYAFGMAAMSPRDKHISQTALVAIAVQAGSNQMLVVREEWGRLLNRLMEDRTNSCTTSHTSKYSQHKKELVNPTTTFCPHYARGKLLEMFLSRFCQSRHHTETEFLRHAMGSLTDAIEFKVEEWTKEESEDGETSEEQTTTREPPCVLSSLLMTAQVIFYLLLPRPEDSQNEEDNQRRDMLVSCAIQLIHHWNYDIASQAAKMLVLAFSYGPSEMIQDYGGPLFESIKLAIVQQLKGETSDCQMVPIEPLVSLLCRKRGEFGTAIMSHIFNLSSTGPTVSGDKEILLYRMVATVAMASPVVAKRQQDEILKKFEKKLNTSSKFHLVASLLSCRHAHFFTPSEPKIGKAVDQLVTSDPCGWDLYLMARHALITGNFKIATNLYDELSATVTTEQNYLWTSALQQVASGESILLSSGALGIPGASSALRSAVVVFQNLSTPCGPSVNPLGLAFQSRYLLLRIDFCELVGTIRKMACEMRLTNVGPKKHTRTNRHLHNAVNLLNVLSTKYLALYRQYGLFMCQQSRTTLRSLHTLCCFVSRATRNTFVDGLHDSSGATQKNVTIDPAIPKGDTAHPMVALMKHLDSAVLKDMSNAVEPKIRAAAFLQVLDGVFKVPHPFPRSFVDTRPLPAAPFRLSLDTGTSDDTPDGDLEEDEVEIPVGTPVSLIATGYISKSMIHCAKVPFYVILIRYQISFHAQTKNGENGQEDAADAESSTNSNTSPVTAEDLEPSSTSLPPKISVAVNGKYQSMDLVP